MVLAVVGSSARFHPQQAVQPIIDSAGAAKPIAAFLVPEAPEALARLSDAGIPSFRTPEACADAIAAALARREPKPAVPTPSGHGGRVLDELEAYALLDRLGVPRAPAVALDTTMAQAPTLPFPYPVAAKVLSADIPHKTEAGGVALNVPDGDTLVAAIRQMRETVKQRTGITPERVLVAPMISGIGEALIGYRVDREAGPLIMVAAGGVFTEIYRDRSLRLAPVDLPTAHAMIAEVKAFATLKGFRGKPAGDLDALAKAIVALSRLGLQNDPAIAEAEVNPLIVRADGVVAVDALVKTYDFVMAGLVPAIHVLFAGRKTWMPGHKGVYARLRRAMAGHDGEWEETLLEKLAARVNADANLVRRGKHVNTTFLIQIDNADHLVSIAEGKITGIKPGPFITPNYSFALRASGDSWNKLWSATPLPGYTDIFALVKKKLLRIEGDLHPFMSNLIYFKGVLAAERSEAAT